MLAAHLFKRAGIIAGCYIDVNGLAALLLPALIAARERARRSVCLNNLDEMGKGLEQYIGQYGGYYPGGNSWRQGGYQDESLSNPDTFTMRNPTSQVYECIRICGNYHGGNDGTGYFRGLGHGSHRWVESDGTGARNISPGLKMSPRGMGWLMYIGALQDAKVFYCPSGKDVVFNRIDNQYNRVPQQTLRNWLNAGGTDIDTLTHGTWSEYNSAGSNSQFNILGQYWYRNTPLHLGHYNTLPGGTDHDPPTAADETYYSQLPITIPYTRPNVTSTANCPAYKTQRRLQTRAIVSDAVDKRGNYSLGGRDLLPGFGNKVHKDGYNVLYGDYHVKWYGDPEQRIIYWDMWDIGQQWGIYNDNTGGWYQTNSGLGYVEIMVGSKFDSRFKCMTGMESALIWQTFDRAAGVDIFNEGEAAAFRAPL